jgi:DNA-binding MarR family transcriptional regulator
MSDDLYSLIRDIRRTFADLRAVSDRMNEAEGITAARRAVMEHLAAVGAATVPQIAETKSVSRQHIQVSVDALLGLDLVEARDNPAHRRSPLIVLTASGAARFAAIRARETALLDGIAPGFDAGQIATARLVLSELRAKLGQLIPPG